KIEGCPFCRAESTIDNHEDKEDRQRNYDQQPGFRSLLAFVLSLPLDVVAARQLHKLMDFLHRFLDSATEVTPAHAVFNSHVPLVSFAINFRRPLLFLNSGQLYQRNAFTGWREQANALDCFLFVAVLRKVTQYEVVPLFSLKNLCEGISANRRLD